MSASSADRGALPQGRSSTKGRRLLFVINQVRFLRSHRLPVLVAAQRAGYEVHVAVPHAPGERAELVAAGFTVHQLPLERVGRNPLRDLVLLAQLVRLYARTRPTLVHHVTVKPVLYGSIAARLARVPAVVNAISGLGFFFQASGWSTRLLRRYIVAGYGFGFRHPNLRVIVQNEDDRDVLVTEGLVDLQRTRLIRGSGVDLRQFAPPAQEPTGAPVVLMLSRMLWDKGVGEFATAARQLREEGIPARFVLVGDTDGNTRGVQPAELDRWAREGILEWWGRREDTPAIVAGASIVVLPTYGGEGTPKTLLEAAACGRAIVTTDVPGCRQLVDDGYNGLVVRPRDAVQLTAAIRQLLTDPALRTAMGRRNRELAEKSLGIESVVSRTLGIYEELAITPPSVVRESR